MIYYMNNPAHREELKRLAKEGNHTVLVAEDESAQPVALLNLRMDSRGNVYGDAKFDVP